MASKAQQALSANLQALSYALGMAQEGQGFNVDVGAGVRAGPIERRRQDPERASPTDMRLEFERGKPLKNLGRVLAGAVGIPLPYNFRQSSEAAEQARIDYENENSAFADVSDTFLSQMEDNAVSSPEGSWQERSYRQYAAAGQNAIAAFYAEDASPQQRAAAAQRLTQLDAEARTQRAGDANQEAQFGRQFVSQEMKDMRQGLERAYMASNDRLMTLDAAAAQWKVLRGLPNDAPDKQAFLRSLIEGTLQRGGTSLGNIAQAVGGVAGAAPNPYAQGAGVALGALGAYLNKEGMLLDGDRVMRQVLAAHDAIGAFEDQLLPQFKNRLDEVTAEGRALGLPGDSWLADRFMLATPNTDALRESLAPAPREPVEPVALDYSGGGTTTRTSPATVPARRVVR